MVAAVLTRPTLVLNRNWQPVSVTSVARSLVMVYNETARVVDPADYQLYTWSDWSAMKPEVDEPFIRTVRFPLRAPEVIVLNRYDRLPAQIVTFSRRNLFKRDRFACQYCGARPPRDELTIDHITPRSRGGVSNWENCVLACVDCNNRKANRTPEEAGLYLKTKPIRPTWRRLYAVPGAPVDSWSRFISEAYWNVELQE